MRRAPVTSSKFATPRFFSASRSSINSGASTATTTALMAASPLFIPAVNASLLRDCSSSTTTTSGGAGGGECPTDAALKERLEQIARKIQQRDTTAAAADAGVPEGKSPKAAPSSVAAAPQSETVTRLSDVNEVSDADKELLHNAFHQPELEKRHEGRRAPLGGVGAGSPNADMAVVFTCNVCKTRSAKRFTKASYERGIVIVQCAGCGNLHLLADHLGWFEDDRKTITDILKDKGEEVQRLAGSIHIDKRSDLEKSDS